MAWKIDSRGQKLDLNCYFMFIFSFSAGIIIISVFIIYLFCEYLTDSIRKNTYLQRQFASFECNRNLSSSHHHKRTSSKSHCMFRRYLMFPIKYGSRQCSKAKVFVTYKENYAYSSLSEMPDAGYSYSAIMITALLKILCIYFNNCK